MLSSWDRLAAGMWRKARAVASRASGPSASHMCHAWAAQPGCPRGSATAVKAVPLLSWCLERNDASS